MHCDAETALHHRLSPAKSQQANSPRPSPGRAGKQAQVAHPSSIGFEVSTLGLGNLLPCGVERPRVVFLQIIPASYLVSPVLQSPPKPPAPKASSIRRRILITPPPLLPRSSCSPPSHCAWPPGDAIATKLQLSFRPLDLARVPRPPRNPTSTLATHVLKHYGRCTCKFNCPGIASKH